MWILAISVGAFLLYLFSGTAAQAQIADWLVLTPRSLVRGHLWKLVTTSILSLNPNGTPNALAVFFDVLMLWLFVPVLEREWGTRRFVWFAVATSLVGNVVSALVGLALAPATPITGLSPFIFASIAGFGTAFAEQPVQFFGVLPMRGKTFALGILAFLVLSVAMNGEWVQGAGYLAAMALAWGFAGGRITPSLWLLRWRRGRLRKKLSVMDGGTRPSPPSPTGRPPKKQEWLN